MASLCLSTWEEAFELIATDVSRKSASNDGGQAIGVIGSNRTTNEENYLLQKFARVVLRPTTSITTAPPTSLLSLRAVAGKPEATATMRDVFNAPAILLIGNDPTEQHPLLAWQIRNNVRLHRAKLVRGEFARDQAAAAGGGFVQIPQGAEGNVAAFLSGDECRWG